MPINAAVPSTIIRRLIRSPRVNAATGTTITGARVPMNSTLATRVSVTAVKNSARSIPKSSPAGATRRQVRRSIRRPRTSPMTCQPTPAAARRQNATTAPGASARRTIVEPADSTSTATTTAPMPVRADLRASAGDGFRSTVSPVTVAR